MLIRDLLPYILIIDRNTFYQKHCLVECQICKSKIRYLSIKNHFKNKHRYGF